MNQLPIHWDTCLLGEVYDVRDGTHDSPKYQSEGYALITSKNLKSSGLNFERVKFIAEADYLKINERSAVHHGDVLFAMIGTIGNPIVVEIEPDFAIKNVALFKVPHEQDSYFLKYYLESEYVKSKMQSEAKGTTQKFVGLGYLRNFPILLPPLPEQKRIVAILDEAFAGISQAVANAEKNLANARELFESYLNNVFTQKGDGWGESTINEVSTVINGYAFKSGDFSDKNTVKSIKITNVGVKEFVIDDSNLLPGDFCKLYDKVAIPEGSIVIALTRSIISSGFKVAVVPVEYDGALLNQRVAALISKSDIVLSQYLYFYLCSTNVIEYVKKNVNTLMQPNLSITDLKSLPVPIPSLENQVEIVDNLRAMEKQVKKLHDIYQKKLTALAELKQSILQRAFSGELH